MVDFFRGNGNPVGFEFRRQRTPGIPAARRTPAAQVHPPGGPLRDQVSSRCSALTRVRSLSRKRDPKDARAFTSWPHPKRRRPWTGEGLSSLMGRLHAAPLPTRCAGRTTHSSARSPIRDYSRGLAIPTPTRSSSPRGFHHSRCQNQSRTTMSRGSLRQP